MFATRNKCIASSNKCLTSSNKKLLVTSALLVVTRTLRTEQRASVEVCTPRGLRNTLGPYLASTDLRPATGAVARQPVFPPGHVPCASEILKHAKRNECQPAKRSAIWLLISQNLSNSLQVLPKMLIDSSCSAPNCSAFFQDLPSSLL